MGLFDPPAVGIRKWLPTSSLRSLTTDAVPPHFGRTQRELIVGFVMAAWALSEHRRGAIPLNDKVGTYISNMGMNCARMLGPDEETALSMVRHLTEKGVIVSPE
jgi:hypothetical protein